MRMMLRVSMPVEGGNAGIKDGSLPRLIESVIQRLKPEATYFFSEDGKRTALFFFDMQETSQMPSVTEPLFMGLNAAVTLSPAMNAEDLRKGLAEAAKHR